MNMEEIYTNVEDARAAISDVHPITPETARQIAEALVALWDFAAESCETTSGLNEFSDAIYYYS